ncbi:hypothetical protein MJ561_13935 [Klebsiella pneumoniae]|nr:hypothetical protein MJ561_13935 [Klebsiella pneumoniae]
MTVPYRPRDGSAVGGYLIMAWCATSPKRGIDVPLDTSVEEILMRRDEVSGVRLINDEKRSLKYRPAS